MSVPSNHMALPKTLSRSMANWVRIAPVLPWLVLGLSLIVTLKLWHTARDEAERELRSDFQARALESSRRIEQRMQDYEQVLAGVRGLFAASQEVDRSEFRAFVSALKIESSFPGVQSVGWVRIVTPAQKSQHIAAMRREGFTNFEILPPGQRDLYAVVTYVEPFSGRNLRAFGLDHYAEPVRRATIEEARDTGETRISGKVRLAQETEQRAQAGFQMALPVFRNGARLDTVAERRANFLGLVGSSFRMDDMMNGIFGVHPEGIDIEIYDGEEISERTLMHDPDGVPHGVSNSPSRLTMTNRIAISGHVWTLVANSLPIYEARLDRAKPQLIAGSGLGTGVLLSLLTWLLMRGRRRALQAALDISASEAKLRAIVDTAMDAVVQMDAQGLVTGWSGQAANLFGWTQAEALGRPLHEMIIPPQYREAHLLGLKRFQQTGESKMLNKRIEIMALRRDGGEFHVELTISLVCLEGKTEFCAFISDITEQKHADALIWKQANFDPLTHLPNRHMFHERLGEDIRAAQSSGLKLAVLFIDLDRFKEVNDTLGHNVGDLLLTEVAQRLGASVRKTDLVARLGGDEFTIILSQLNDTQQVDTIAQNILRRLAEPFTLNEEMAYISASMGITLYPEDAREVEQLLMNADQAMYAAKQTGRNRVNFFVPDSKPAESVAKPP